MDYGVYGMNQPIPRRYYVLFRGTTTLLYCFFFYFLLLHAHALARSLACVLLLIRCCKNDRFEYYYYFFYFLLHFLKILMTLVCLSEYYYREINYRWLIIARLFDKLHFLMVFFYRCFFVMLLTFIKLTKKKVL